jgi:hypothetical protein
MEEEEPYYKLMTSRRGPAKDRRDIVTNTGIAE